MMFACSFEAALLSPIAVYVRIPNLHRPGPSFGQRDAVRSNRFFFRDAGSAPPAKNFRTADYTEFAPPKQPEFGSNPPLHGLADIGGKLIKAHLGLRSVFMHDVYHLFEEHEVAGVSPNTGSDHDAVPRLFFQLGL